MVVPNNPGLLGQLTSLFGIDLQQREPEYRATMDALIPAIFWGATPSKVELVPFLEPVLPRRLYKVEFDAAPRPGVPTQLLVDLKMGRSPQDGGVFVNNPFPSEGDSYFDGGARLQELARSVIPHLVPRVIRLGIAHLPDGNVDYIVTEHIPGALTLDKIWASLSLENQGRIVGALIDGIEPLHKLNVNNMKTSNAISSFDFSGDVDYTIDYAASDPAGFAQQLASSDDSAEHAYDHSDHGCPCPDHATRHLDYMRILMSKFVHDAQHRHHPPTAGTVPFLDGGFDVYTIDLYTDDPDDAVATTEFPHWEVQELAAHNGICHMDLEPRNILVKPVTPKDPSNQQPTEYELAGITSWEKAVLAPFAYERGVKDGMLGCQFNYDYDWYRLFVERSKRLLPEGAAHDKFIGAAVLIKAAARHISVEHPNTMHQMQWIFQEKLVPGLRLRDGYVRALGYEGLVSPSEAEYRDMGDEIVRGVVARMQAANANHGADDDSVPEDASDTDRPDKDSDDDESEFSAWDEAYSTDADLD